MPRALRFVIAAAIAFAIWWYATPAYNELLCRILQRLGVFVEPAGRAIRAMRAGASNAQIPADQMTYNIILFAGLVAAVPPRIWKVIIATIILVAFHIAAIAVNIEYTYVKSGLWMSLDFLYRIGGMFAIAFVCWYAATTPAAPGPRPETPRKSGRAGRARPRGAAASR